MARPLLFAFIAFPALRGHGLAVADPAIHEARSRVGLAVTGRTGGVEVGNLPVLGLSFDVQKGFGHAFICFPVAERAFRIAAFHVLHMPVVREKDRRHGMRRQRGKGDGDAFLASGRVGEKSNAQGENQKAE